MALGVGDADGVAEVLEAGLLLDRDDALLDGPDPVPPGDPAAVFVGVDCGGVEAHPASAAVRVRAAVRPRAAKPSRRRCRTTIG